MSQTAAVDEDALYAKVLRHIVPLFFLGFVLSYLDRVNISLAKLPMSADFGLTEHAFAMAASIFFWGYMLFEIPSNLLLQRVGARIWLARIMITWGIVSTLMVFSRSVPVLYGLRLLLGICEAGFVPGVLFYANTWLPVRRQSGMFALFLSALPAAEVIGAPLSGFILEHLNGIAGLRGWQWLFLLEGAPTVALGVVIFLLLRNRPADAPWLTPPERLVLEQNVASESTGKPHSFASALRSPRIYLLIVIMILWNTSFYGLLFWLPTLVRNAGVGSSSRVGQLTAIPFLVGGITMILLARLAERLQRQRAFAVGAAAVAAIGMFAARALEGNLPLVLAALSVTVAGVLTLMPMYWTLPGRLLSGSAIAGGLALINSCGSLSGVLGVLIIGYAGMQYGMAVFAGMLAAASLLLSVAMPTRAATT